MTEFKPRTPEETYDAALQRARQDLARQAPHLVAARAGLVYRQLTDKSGEFAVPFWGQQFIVTFPDGIVTKAESGEPPSIAEQILTLHYLTTADGVPITNHWIAFRELPGGMGYAPAFQGRADNRLKQAFGSDAQGFHRAAKALNGESLSFGDASYLFRIFPKLWLAVVLYLADEEFSASARVLFDGAASHYLPTEDLAVIGGILAGRLIKAR
ncbi:MAG: hypothetical protein B6I34_06595 [Anaerolineaceae bacterium 4572_32.1]|nr:MAG: hypothetical protein B6I34_06595 [Anaerolineaceae bacterium 4572_32.1]